MSGVFASLLDVKQYTPINAGFTMYDTQIEAQITAVSDMIRAYCRRKFDRAEYTQRAMSGRAFVTLIESPIDPESVTVEYDPTGRYAPNEFEELTEDTDYGVDADTGQITFYGNTIVHPRGFRLTYTGGYDYRAGSSTILQVPANVTMATAMQVVFMMQRQRAGSLGVDQEEKARNSLRKYSISATTGMLSEVEALLSGYRRTMVGSS